MFTRIWCIGNSAVAIFEIFVCVYIYYIYIHIHTYIYSILNIYIYIYIYYTTYIYIYISIYIYIYICVSWNGVLFGGEEWAWNGKRNLARRILANQLLVQWLWDWSKGLIGNGIINGRLIYTFVGHCIGMAEWWIGKVPDFHCIGSNKSLGLGNFNCMANDEKYSRVCDITYFEICFSFFHEAVFLHSQNVRTKM